MVVKKGYGCWTRITKFKVWLYTHPLRELRVPTSLFLSFPFCAIGVTIEPALYIGFLGRLKKLMPIKDLVMTRGLVALSQ